MGIPKGFGYVAGRSGDTARELLAKADEAGIDRKVAVRTTVGGYYVDERLLETELTGEKVDDPNAETTGSVTLPDGTVTDTVPVEDGSHTSVTGDAEVVKADDQNAGQDAGPVTSTEIVPPAKNASTDVWAKFAQEYKGYNPEEGLTRNELVERYGE